MKYAAIRLPRLRTTERRNHATILRRLTLRDPFAMPEVPRRPRRSWMPASELEIKP